MMTIQVPTIFDMMVALVLAGWTGIGGVKLLTSLAYVIRSLAHRISNLDKVWVLELERKEQLAYIARLERLLGKKPRGSRTRKRG